MQPDVWIFCILFCTERAVISYNHQGNRKVRTIRKGPGSLPWLRPLGRVVLKPQWAQAEASVAETQWAGREHLEPRHLVLICRTAVECCRASRRVKNLRSIPGLKKTTNP